MISSDPKAQCEEGARVFGFDATPRSPSVKRMTLRQRCSVLVLLVNWAGAWFAGSIGDPYSMVANFAFGCVQFAILADDFLTER